VEVVVGALDENIYVVDGATGQNKSGWPVWNKDTVFSSPAVFDLDGDGKLDVIIAGDVYYEPEMSDRATAWLRRCILAGTDVILADPGRGYMPSDGVDELATYAVPTTLDLEDREMRQTTIFRPRLY